MRGIGFDMNESSSKGEGECTPQYCQSNQKNIGNGVSSCELKHSSKDEPMPHEAVNERHTKVTEAQPASDILQLQPQGPQVSQGSVVRWERFLPVRSLRVLLVETDDSTRHVVSALLRNCSYEVTAAASGLEAWNILEDSTNHIDLVLTEVEMPNLSGTDLLSKITSHRSYRNIPVIMMSSNDSMGIVFNCLSSGALDFLVKPIRKNELKNLWQHVWRKCHSSSGSGSESGIQIQKSIKSKRNGGSKNDTDSNDEHDNGSIGLNLEDGSDNGSGTQSSWSKRAVEIESAHPISSRNQLTDPPHGTCALNTHSRPDELHDKQVDAITTIEQRMMDNELGAEKFNNQELKGEAKELETVDLNDEALGSQSNEADLEGGSADVTQLGQRGDEVPHLPLKVNKIKNTASYDSKEEPSLELSLKQLRNVSDNGTSAQEHNVLRHSDLSAFSRYNNSKAVNHSPTGNVGSCSPVDNTLEAAKTDSMHNLISNSSGTPNGRSDRSSNNNDMGSTTNHISYRPESFGDNPKCSVNMHQESEFPPVQDCNDPSPKPVSASQNNSLKPQIQVQHHHHHYHHYHHHVRNSKQQLDHDENYGSASGSNNGSGQNGSSTGVTAEGTNVSSDNGEAVNCGAFTPSSGGFGSGCEPDQNRLAQRQAALNKFRLKRKERCFEKKVRYQSRKRLAEQRPRVRGQFVKHHLEENISEGADS